MNKMIRVLAIIPLLLVSACSSPPPSSNSTNTTTSPPVITEGINVGNLALNFQLQTLDGQTISLRELKGKPVLVNFWATWCGPCQFEMPFLQQIHNDWSDKELVLLAIDIGESPATVEKFMADRNLSLTVLLDLDVKVARDYGITNIPTTFFIDKEGIIRRKVQVSFPNKEAIESELSKIIP